MLAFITIPIMEKELKKLKSENAKELLIYQVEKEIEILKRLKIEEINMRGTTKEFAERIIDENIIFLTDDEREKYSKAMDFYNNCKKQLFE